MLEGLTSKIESLKMDEDAIWFQVVNREAQFEIIRLNTLDQLFNDGVRSDGLSLPDYSTRSVVEFGKRSGHITLRDTGDFYQSFVVRVDSTGINIFADAQKKDNNLTEIYGTEILGLTSENIGLLRDMILINYREVLRNKIAL